MASSLKFIKCENHKKWIKVGQKMIDTNTKNILSTHPVVTKPRRIHPSFQLDIADKLIKNFKKSQQETQEPLGLNQIFSSKFLDTKYFEEKPAEIRLNFKEKYDNYKQDYIQRQIQAYLNLKSHDSFFESINWGLVDEISKIYKFSRFQFIQEFYKFRIYLNLYLHENGKV